MIDARKDIIFRDENYQTKFKIKDGDSIKITLSYDGEELVRKCRYLDSHHLYVGSNCYHIDEFMERMTQIGNKYEPIPNQSPKLDILVIEQGEKPQSVEVPINITALCDIVGGQLKISKLNENTASVKGENGNGNMLICGLNNDKLTSLHPYNEQTYKIHYIIPKEKKPSIVNQLSENKEKIVEPPKINLTGKKKSDMEH